VFRYYTWWLCSNYHSGDRCPSALPRFCTPPTWRVCAEIQIRVDRVVCRPQIHPFLVPSIYLIFLSDGQRCITALAEQRNVRTVVDEKSYDEIVVFPIAIPFIAGPATLATIILLIGNSASFPEFHITVILALVAALFVSLLLMIGGSYIVKFLPKQFLHTTARVMAFILAALATQFIVDGIKASFNI